MAVNKTNYQHKLQPVIRYLEGNFKEPLNLKKVAEKAYLSPYHFHRIFKAVTHETLAGYLRRLKLEHAAQRIFYHQESITEIALTLGFSSSQSFAKAFRQYFGISATDIRNCMSLEQYCSLIRDSKIGHLLRNNGNATHAESKYDSSGQQQGDDTMTNTIKTENVEERLLAYVRVTGPYGLNYEGAQERLYQWAGAHALANGDSIYIYHDNPEITPNEKCRTDICIAVPLGTKVPEGIELQTLPAGSYAYLRDTITENSQYGKCWDKLMTQVVNSGLVLDERPCFEFYHSYDLQTNVADVGFYTAVKF